MKYPINSRRRSTGFTLVEALVSVFLVAVGLLGVSKMQAAGISNSQTARTRALIAFQASSLGALIHGNHAFWGTAASSVIIKSPKALSGPSSTALAVTTDCASADCTPAALAAHDLDQWASAMAVHFPTYEAAIDCAAPAGSSEFECQVSVKWDEKFVAVNASTGGSAAAQTATQTYTLAVRP